VSILWTTRFLGGIPARIEIGRIRGFAKCVYLRNTILPPVPCQALVVRRVNVATGAKTERAPATHGAAIGVLHGLAYADWTFALSGQPIPVPRRFTTPPYRPAKLWKTSSGPTQPECARVNTGHSIIWKNGWAAKLSASSHPN
jgi:hypothetical protein